MKFKTESKHNRNWNDMLLQSPSKPILFSTEMVKAILEGRKTMTRRKVKFKYLCGDIVASVHPTGSGKSWVAWTPKPVSAKETIECYPDDEGFKCPYGEVGDLIWVREKFKVNNIPTGYPYHFYANNDTFTNPDYEKWKPSIFMPKEAARIWLQITDIRIEKIQDITEEDAKAEGVRDYNDNDPIYPPDYSLCPSCGGQLVHGCFGENYGVSETDCMQCDTYKKRFKILWHNINGSVSWDENVWVWVVNFKIISGCQ